MATQTIARTTMKAKEAAGYLGISYWTLLQKVREKKIPCIKMGKRLLFRQETLAKWLAEQEAASQVTRETDGLI